jgi:hypothetical protein
MSLIKKSDVKNHLRTGATGKLLPFRHRSQPDATGYSNDRIRDSETTAPIMSASTGGQSSVTPGCDINSGGTAIGSDLLANTFTIKAPRP